ncbi:hypothetical protein A2526_04810 [candidate division WOR-1 bacterium RIFOXYD2_FULL_36_8]|uniref:Uncharacterized protein n=1 Tax=candidate division WOR-1 bacterium RIFOXYB2_FULL_36_35 TaxID=1802578 RepID=A0A1F4S0W4_UNCSA|nr:MAG: hypothetical protein A2230_07790 [candidate division WOR-1 bacterium RIFOXYA2_FULL_36_21]OGC13373.1 MAG: hypothetical protein A2290_02590 [candidate division WOR-1 bacterium RIFOXYB2_FULL_36_35]OGC15423.1 MAG: hypothetical protein A2282_08870 [candidate division WOR-1 bacterium RIFOXYA12_FULL_36_13]OGC41438.1 MAG: hypothetical protein A2526_04810 [candidate division WOR-1 bacterium RIFOXYD2_FULL_36_8]
MFLLYLLFVIREDLMQNKSLANEKLWLISKSAFLTGENVELVKKLENIKHKNVIEKIAREKLNLVKKKEIAFKICQ